MDKKETTTEYPAIDLTGWIKTGEGSNGCTYENPERPDVLLKINKAGRNDLKTVMEECAPSAQLAKLGLPTPAMLGIVRVGDGYASLSERIVNKKSIFRICHDEPHRIEEMAVLFSDLGKSLFSTPCNTEFFPSQKMMALRGIDRSGFVGRKTAKILRKFIEDIPESTGCVHGDYQPGNVIVSGGKCYWIDLGRFAWGCPMFDIGHLYMSCVVYSGMRQVQEIFHLNESQLLLFWDSFAKAYTGQTDHTQFDREAARYGAVTIVLNQAWQPRLSLPYKLFFRSKVKSLMKYF